MKDRYSSERRDEQPKVPEARFAYYRRCQLFRRNGEQCKAPAETGAQICHAHAAQQAMAFRRELERRIVLAEAVAEMRRLGRPECELADLLTDFKGIQVTLAVVSRALIAGRIDCKTAGRLLVRLQTMSKLSWMVHRTKTKNLPLINTDNTDMKRAAEGPSLTTEARRHGEQQGSPQICAEDRRSNKSHEPGLPAPLTAFTSAIKRDIDGEDLQGVLKSIVSIFPASRRDCRDGPWEQPRAA
ncbi:MAG TPA: hypothetical protein VKV30_00800 [Candidatus Angelobacter sp.]|nr:hypothetical protein [Candidatus Angelobacter sp.]